MPSFKLEGNIVDLFNREIFTGEIHIKNGIIKNIIRTDAQYDHYILPGFIDAHIHIESSMLIPSEFARLAVVHGTVATVSDPHEIANVCGIEGVNYMINNGKKVPFHFNFGAPSCVPATSFETAGAIIDSNQIDALLSRPEIKYLSEMMNYPGVIYKDEEVWAKLKSAQKHQKPIDGHVPGIVGDQLDQYLLGGITTDHEAFTYEEGLEKLQKGMILLIREGSAAKNFEALIPLIDLFPKQIMFCSDDKHPDDLILGHINQLVARAIHKGHNLFDVLYAACIHPALHYKLEHGLLREGDKADLIVVEDLKHFNVTCTYLEGIEVAHSGKTKILSINEEEINNFHCKYIEPEEVNVWAKSEHINCINIIEGQLVTTSSIENATIENGFAISDPKKDMLKMVVKNRYNSSPPQVCFVKNSGLKTGAFASTVAHDSHNIICIGVEDESILAAINLLVDSKGGISYFADGQFEVLPLPVAGLMSNDDAYKVADQYESISNKTKQNCGTHLSAPFMTLSFLALLVIPTLKLSDKGLFDGQQFKFTELFV